MKILIIKTSSMGDIIHTLPAITDAAKHIPDLQIDWVIEEAFAEIPRWHPAIHKVIPVALRRWRKHPLKAIFSTEWKNFYTQLRATPYDLIIDAQGLMKSAFITRLGRGVRCGFAGNSIREPLAASAYQQHYEINKRQHAITRTRELFAAVLGYSFNPDIVNYGLNSDLIPLPAFTLPENYCVFVSNTSRLKKRWPQESWKHLLRNCQQKNIPVLLPCGIGTEVMLTQDLAEAFSNAIVLPHCSLTQLLEVLAHAEVIVTVDTGLSHLAAAIGKATIVIYGPTDPMLIGTRGEQQQHLMNPTPHAVWDEMKGYFPHASH